MTVVQRHFSTRYHKDPPNKRQYALGTQDFQPQKLLLCTQHFCLTQMGVVGFIGEGLPNLLPGDLQTGGLGLLDCYK